MYKVTFEDDKKKTRYLLGSPGKEFDYEDWENHKP